MAVELKIPTVGESITEAVIGEWLKKVGEAVAQDEPVVVIETDKVTVELPAPQAGRLAEILKESGEEAKIGEVIGYLEPDGGDGKAGKKAASKAASAKDATPAKAGEETAEKAPARGREKAPEKAPVEPERPSPESAGKAPAAEARVMPAARRLLAEAGLDASEVEATGPGGRLLKEDVARHLESKATPAAVEPAPAPAPAEPAPAPRLGVYREEEVVKMTPLRRRVAARLVEAQQSAALLTTFNEIDMSAVIALRKQYQDRFVAAHGVKLGFMSFFVKAVVEALKELPQVNAEIRGQDIVYRNYFDVGIAVGGGRGLVVPIIRNAERLSFAEIEKAVGDYGRRAKDNQLKLEELQGGTFTISNGGIYGSLLSTPIVNPPQSGILGMHAIQERPVARDGQVVIRPMMYVALTYDHRLVDGREAVTFLVRVKERVEDPTRILLET